MTVFQEVSPRVVFRELEEKVLAFWQEEQVFRQQVDLHREGKPWVFYEGPPTANGLPHVGHVLTRIYKDIFPRYHAMKGEYVIRKGGWDTHGLPVEIEVEKELGFSGKQAIEKYGIAPFNQKCRESVFRYVAEWRRLTDRIGFWIDMDDPYVTLHNNYVESVWWILRRFWDEGLLYQGYKVVPYCPRCGTPLSSHEVSLGYKDTEDPSAYVKFPLRDEPGAYFLSWTTTPWTLPGNVALAVHPKVRYARVQVGDDQLILAEDLVHDVLGDDVEVLAHMSGRDLIGTHYRPLYTFMPVDREYAYVVAGDFVTTDEGTGIVHVAPAFGADDMTVGRANDLPVIMTVEPNGTFCNDVKPWRGLFVKDADPLIIEELDNRGLLFREEVVTHSYPFCWRCSTPLLYYARLTWYVETSHHQERLLANNQKINWHPEHVRDGRFGNWLENNVDWALGRERYWGTPLPVWECDSCHHQECIGGIAQLGEKVAGEDAPAESWPPDDLDLHRPYIDGITWPCSKCPPGTMRRVPEVIDCWFDSGAMPVAQWHYPFENQEKFEEQFPADFICEAVDQTRGWFYSLHAIASLLFDRPAYRNCLVLGLVLDGEGHKMSKSLGNTVKPFDVIDVHGSDAMRWYLFTAAPPWNERRFSVDLVGETLHKFMLTLWNVYSFFVMYANIDSLDPTKHDVPVSERSALDRWILSELHTLTARVDEGLAGYEATGPARDIQEFVELLSNWYVRRSRRRFWRSENDTDKVGAYLTLYECLTTVAGLLAPFTPFLSETLYRNLVLSVNPEAPISVHLTPFPVANEALIDADLMASTRLIMRLTSLGHAARNRSKIKIRQPLSEVRVAVREEAERDVVRSLSQQFIEELNVKGLALVEESDLVSYRLSARPDRLGPRFGKQFPQVRAALGAADAASLVRALRAGETITLAVGGETVTLEPDDVNIETVEREGLAVASDGGYLVGVTTTLTEELRHEGIARDLVRHIQELRKGAGFQVTDRIVTYVETTGPVATAVTAQRAYIKRETLSEQIVAAPPPEGVATESFALADTEVVLGVALAT
ncbi:MAG: isoleucine--tRNA ligase [Chloroflexi bacterium]|nr:isoleucine--tRNA ligase [Chloroflexota bacterium]